MADLDDFFAKKDKKKGKSKKYLSSEELVKQLEQTAKESEQSKKPAKIEEESEITNNEVTIDSDKATIGHRSWHQILQNDDEWKEVEEEKRPDLSNLKLGQLNIDKSNENNQNYSGGNDYEHENSNNDGDNGENPWNKANSTQGGAKPAPTLPDPAKQIKPAGAYVPPSLLRAEVRSSCNRVTTKSLNSNLISLSFLERS